MAEQKIVKNTRKVQVTLCDGRQIPGEVFLALFGAHHSGQQHLDELLNGEETFIPFRTGNSISLLNIEKIMMMKTESREEFDELMTLGKKYLVKVAVQNCKVLQGEVFVNLPDDNSRVRDWLNQSTRFLPIFFPDAIIYVNRAQIISVQD